MRAVLVEGGGVRSAFAAGVLDALLEHDEPFDLVAGTSAGALLAAAYLAGQKGRSLRVLRDPGCRAAFGRITDFLRGGDLVDLELLHETADRLETLDGEALMMHPARFLLTVTDVDTGLGHVLEPSSDELTDALKATSALPIAVRSPIRVRGMTCLDGGIAIPLPVQHIIDLGATELVVVRTRQASY
ncbi:MAG: patatin-like phospholipase family protein, partial [Candidatus Thermoplasmatota archaeon]|nr:patatin-like phospholipase family protein [Candidatus Thermoplasmatota archaeon]